MKKTSVLMGLVGLVAIAGGLTSCGKNSAEIRQIAINAKEYIKKNGITEDDGSEMTIPIY